MKSIKEVDVNNKRVIVRVDYNVPIKNNKIVDDTRIKASLETINYLINNNAKIILLSHLGRIETEEDKKNNSLEIVAKYLSSLVKSSVYFIPATRGKEIENAAKNLIPQEILLLENTRYEDVPDKKESNCDKELSKYWSKLGDIFVLDAFASAHRCHASTYGISEFIPSYSGFLVDKEIELLKKVINNNKILIMGGAKVDDKIGVIENLIDNTEKVLLGGAMCFTFLKAKGINVGKSKITEEKLEYCKDLLKKHNKKIILPLDIVTENGIKKINELNDEDIGYDIGPATINMYTQLINNGKLVLWNGPLGMYEDDKYKNGTLKIMKYLHNKNVDTILAGGDIVAASNSLNIKFDNICTGGGATLEYLEGKEFKTLERLNGE